MAFEPGKSGNPKGRPTKEEQALRGLSQNELKGLLRQFKKAAPDAVAKIIAAMDDESIPKATRLKYAKEVFDMYVKTLQVDKQLKKEDGALDTDAEPEEAIVFRIV